MHLGRMVSYIDVACLVDKYRTKKDFEVDEIGNVYGYDIFSIKWGHGKKKFVSVGGLHGGEFSGMFSFDSFLRSELHKFNPEEMTYYAITPVNPYGLDHSRRRNRSNERSTTGSDLNRDWEKFLEPETLIVKDAIDSVLDDADCAVVLDKHECISDEGIYFIECEESLEQPIRDDFYHLMDLHSMWYNIPMRDAVQAAMDEPTYSPTTLKYLNTDVWLKPYQLVAAKRGQMINYFGERDNVFSVLIEMPRHFGTLEEQTDVLAKVECCAAMSLFGCD